jgi:hypothetical protein
MKELADYTCPDCRNKTLQLAWHGPLYCYTCGWKGTKAIAPPPDATTTALIAERDALLAELIALKHRLADARTISTMEYTSDVTGKHLLPCIEMPRRGTYLLIPVEDGE